MACEFERLEIRVANLAAFVCGVPIPMPNLQRLISNAQLMQKLVDTRWLEAA